jgi:hypothetical protein
MLIPPKRVTERETDMNRARAPHARCRRLCRRGAPLLPQRLMAPRAVISLVTVLTGAQPVDSGIWFNREIAAESADCAPRDRIS